MAQTVNLWGAIYSDVPAIDVPSGQGTARFSDASVTTAVESDVAQGKTFLKADGSVATGTGSGGSYEDGDEMEYGTPGLAGTTWLFNNSPALPSGTTKFYIDFLSNNVSYTRIDISGVSATDGTMGYTGQSSVTAYMKVGSYIHWESEAYKTISITGGTDATNATLIAWLQANATQVS